MRGYQNGARSQVQDARLGVERDVDGGIGVHQHGRAVRKLDVAPFADGAVIGGTGGRGAVGHARGTRRRAAEYGVRAAGGSAGSRGCGRGRGSRGYRRGCGGDGWRGGGRRCRGGGGWRRACRGCRPGCGGRRGASRGTSACAGCRRRAACPG
ncbi:hypothetical protein G6F22_018138 [Rhizopus arrhizus]|nr:hypothetical protein G6F22_018138 [Rhizopus arrhizus]